MDYIILDISQIFKNNKNIAPSKELLITISNINIVLIREYNLLRKKWKLVKIEKLSTNRHGSVR